MIHYRVTLIFLHCRKTQGGVCASKAEAVGQRNVDLFLLGYLGDVVAIELFRWVPGGFQIQCWRQSVLTWVSIRFVVVLSFFSFHLRDAAPGL